MEAFENYSRLGKSCKSTEFQMFFLWLPLVLEQATFIKT